MDEDEDLDRRLITAHAENDLSCLVALYAQAAHAAGLAGHADRAAFYRTHAMIFALEAGDPEAEGLRAMLAAEGRA